MLDGIKILIERLNASEQCRWAEHLAEGVIREDGPIETFTAEEKASVREALINYRRAQFTARVVTRVSGTDEMTDTQWIGEAAAKTEGRQYRPVEVGNNLIISKAQMEMDYRMKTQMGLR